MSDYVAPKFRQVAPILNPVSGKIHLFGVTFDGEVLEYSTVDCQWHDIDHSEAGFID